MRLNGPLPEPRGMSLLSIALAAIGAIVLILQAARAVPLAVAALLNACEPVIVAYRSLRNLLHHNDSE